MQLADMPPWLVIVFGVSIAVGVVLMLARAHRTSQHQSSWPGARADVQAIPVERLAPRGRDDPPPPSAYGTMPPFVGVQQGETTWILLRDAEPGQSVLVVGDAEAHPLAFGFARRLHEGGCGVVLTLVDASLANVSSPPPYELVDGGIAAVADRAPFDRVFSLRPGQGVDPGPLGALVREGGRVIVLDGPASRLFERQDGTLRQRSTDTM